LQASALAAIELLLIGRSPLSGKCIKMDTEFMYPPDNNEIDFILQNQESRIKKIYELYTSISLSYQKAKIAFTLALYELEQGSIAQSEQLLYEAVYILDNSLSSPSVLPLIFTERP